MIPDSDTFMKLLQNPEQVLKSIIEDLDTSTKNMQAFGTLSDLYDAGKDVDQRKVLTACAKSLRHANDVNRRLLILAMVYVSGSNFTTDAATVLSKLGRGDEALRHMFKKKMEGR